MVGKAPGAMQETCQQLNNVCHMAAYEGGLFVAGYRLFTIYGLFNIEYIIGEKVARQGNLSFKLTFLRGALVGHCGLLGVFRCDPLLR